MAFSFFSLSSFTTVILITITIIVVYIFNRNKSNSKQNNKNYVLIKSYNDLYKYKIEASSLTEVGNDIIETYVDILV